MSEESLDRGSSDAFYKLINKFPCLLLYASDKLIVITDGLYDRLLK